MSCIVRLESGRERERYEEVKEISVNVRPWAEFKQQTHIGRKICFVIIRNAVNQKSIECRFFFVYFSFYRFMLSAIPAVHFQWIACCMCVVLFISSFFPRFSFCLVFIYFVHLGVVFLLKYATSTANRHQKCIVLSKNWFSSSQSFFFFFSVLFVFIHVF